MLARLPRFRLDPDRPVTTVSVSRGMSRSTSFRIVAPPICRPRFSTRRAGGLGAGADGTGVLIVRGLLLRFGRRDGVHHLDRGVDQHPERSGAARRHLCNQNCFIIYLRFTVNK